MTTTNHQTELSIAQHTFQQLESKNLPVNASKPINPSVNNGVSEDNILKREFYNAKLMVKGNMILATKLYGKLVMEEYAQWPHVEYADLKTGKRYTHDVFLAKFKDNDEFIKNEAPRFIIVQDSIYEYFIITPWLKDLLKKANETKCIFLSTKEGEFYFYGKRHFGIERKDDDEIRNAIIYLTSLRLKKSFKEVKSGLSKLI